MINASCGLERHEASFFMRKGKPGECPYLGPLRLDESIVPVTWGESAMGMGNGPEGVSEQSATEGGRMENKVRRDSSLW